VGATTLLDSNASASYPWGSRLNESKNSLRIGIAIFVVLGTVIYLAISAAQANKSYYVTISELHNMRDKAYTRHLRVAGNVGVGSIQRSGTRAQFTLVEQGKVLPVQYQGAEPPPDTFKDNAQALAIGTYGRDGVFHATELQAKCASKYAPANPATPAAAKPATNSTASLQHP
jgi:cytochrome c-type biogenesis protein CcmE